MIGEGRGECLWRDTRGVVAARVVGVPGFLFVMDSVFSRPMLGCESLLQNAMRAAR